jgi:hypothetical protein
LPGLNPCENKKSVDVSFGTTNDFLDSEGEKLRMVSVTNTRREMYRSTGKLSPFLNKPPYQTTASVSEASSEETLSRESPSQMIG